jgi:hypothetical protein
MVEVIEKQEPAIMVCHWPGIYYNGEKIGFNILKDVVGRLNEKYDNLYWMTLSEIARYWAAKKLTKVSINKKRISISAPFESKDFTLGVNMKIRSAELVFKNERKPFELRGSVRDIHNGTYFRGKNESVLCFKLPKGESEIVLT